MGNETVSIIMPAYNAEETIKDSILSILKQTYEDFKLYIINDNSSDSTEHIIKSIIDERIVYLLNRNGKGVSSARNVGIAAWLVMVDILHFVIVMMFGLRLNSKNN
ncbi:TPA: glycosyltransferase family 2 protein [Escherichia coli]